MVTRTIGLHTAENIACSSAFALKSSATHFSAACSNIFRFEHSKAVNFMGCASSAG
jgi:hypothetical protein